MNINIYKDMYNTEGKIHLINNPRIQKMVQIFNSLNLHNKKILDFGCLDGTFLGYIDNKTNELYGLDASEYAVEESKKKGIKVKNYFFDDVKPIPYEDSSFDFVILGEVIEHIYDTDFLLKELHRILKKDGYLLISTPNIASFGRRLSLMLGINPIIELSPNEKDSSGHIRYFTFSSLHDLLVKHKFSKISTCTDVINLTGTGSLRIKVIPNFLNTFGASIIGLYKKS